MLVGVLHWSHAKLCQKTWRRDWFAFFFAEGLKCKEISLETLMSWVIAAVLWVKCLIWRLYETAAFLVGHGQRDQSQKGECRMQNFWMGFRFMKQILYLYYLSSIRSIHLSLGLEVPTLGLAKVTSRGIFAALRHGSILFGGADGAPRRWILNTSPAVWLWSLQSRIYDLLPLLITHKHGVREPKSTKCYISHCNVVFTTSDVSTLISRMEFTSTAFLWKAKICYLLEPLGLGQICNAIKRALCQVHVGTLLLTWCPIAIVVYMIIILWLILIPLFH